MKPYSVNEESGMSWLGNIPMHWDARPLRRIARIHLSNILRAFNDLFGNIPWGDADKIGRVIAEEIPAKVSADRAYQNAVQNSDKENARIEHDIALQRVLVELLSDHTELFKQFSENPAFKKWLSDTVFAATFHPPGSGE